MISPYPMKSYTAKMFDTKDEETYKSIKDKNDKIEAEYKDQLERYERNMKKMSKIRAEIWDKVADIRHRIDNMNYLRSLFAREYLPLVDDDTERYIREGIKDYPLFSNNID